MSTSIHVPRTIAAIALICEKEKTYGVRSLESSKIEFYLNLFIDFPLDLFLEFEFKFPIHKGTLYKEVCLRGPMGETNEPLSQQIKPNQWQDKGGRNIHNEAVCPPDVGSFPLKRSDY